MTLARLVAGLAAAVLLVGCSSGPEPAADAKPADAERGTGAVTEAQPAGFERYVALGDSFTAAPLVPDTALAEGCFRSDGNYPNLVADRLGIGTLVDVSCSGAETRDLEEPQRTVENGSVPPQLRAVDGDTDLVTLGIGGNDFDLFATLVATCSRIGRQGASGSPCVDRLEQRGIDLVGLASRIETRVERATRQVRGRAPEATVVVVGYPRLTPTSGSCRALPFAPGDYQYGARVSETLNDALSSAAASAGVSFVDMYTRSEGHDICSDEAWVNGAKTVQGVALAFHPLAAGQEAVADAVVEELEELEKLDAG